MSTKQDLVNELALKKKELLILRFQNKSGQLKQTHLIKKTKKVIAQLLTKTKSKK